MAKRWIRISLVAALLAAGGITTLIVAQPALAATAAFTRTSSWDTGYQAQFTITNNTSTTTTSWNVQFDLPAGTSMGTYWDALVATSGQHVTATNRNYNGSLSPGTSTTFGFVAVGTGNPTNCTVNGVACGGGGGPTPTQTKPPTTAPPTAVPPTTAPPTTLPPTTAPPTSTPPGGGTVRVAPYVDMGAWPTPSLTQMASGGNLKSFTLGFVTASACKAMWFNAYDPRQQWGLDQITAIRAAGGDVKVSFGGASGIELAQACSTVDSLLAEYQAVVTAYSLTYVDLDIEGAASADPASVTRRSQAIARLQRAKPGLKVSLTLPVLPEGLTSDGLNVVRSARDAGVTVDLVNIMAMDYYRTGDYGSFAVQAAQATFSQIKGLYPALSDAAAWRMIGVTPMLGQNDDGHIYDQVDARQLVTFAQQQHLGMLAFWEMTRDRNACTGALYMCTNIAQQPYEFSRIFAGYTG
jgi:Cellulose binding domain